MSELVNVPPGFTVIIPAYQRPVRLARCLQALSSMDYAAFTVVVVDDGSEPSLEPVVTPFIDQFSWRYVRQQNQGPAAARNTGAKLAETEWIAFTDDDCRPHRAWLSNLASSANLADTAAARRDTALGGRVINAFGDNIFAETSQLLIDYLYGYYERHPQVPSFFTSNNLAFPTEAFRAINGFDQSFPLAAGEDREICDRWRRSGRSLRYVNQALVDHEHELTVRRFWNQHFHYGRGAWHFRSSRARNSGEPVRVEPWGFYRDLLLYPFTRERGLKAILSSGLIVLSQFANVAGFFHQRFADRRRL